MRVEANQEQHRLKIKEDDAVEALLKTKSTLQIHAIVEKVSRHDLPLCSMQSLIVQ